MKKNGPGFYSLARFMLIAMLLLTLSGAAGSGQNGFTEDPNISPELLKIFTTSNGPAPSDAEQQLIIEASDSSQIAKLEEQIRSLGGIIESSYESRIQARLPISKMNEVAALPDVRYIRRPFRPVFSQGDVRGEGIVITGADHWHDAGLKGEGVKLAILDGGFYGYKSLIGTELPNEEKVITRSFRSDRDVECGSCPRTVQLHGLAVAEIAHDIAPDATLYLVNFDTELELQIAIDWLISEKIDVINSSFGFITTSCPYEGTGYLDPTFKKARDAGIFWAASAGNDALMHWSGNFEDADDNGFASFLGDDESQTITSVREGEFVEAILWWDDPCSGAFNDYDIVIENSGGEVLDRSFRAGPTEAWPLEVLSFEAPVSGTYEVRIEQKAGDQSNRLNLLFVSPNHEPEFKISEGTSGLTEPELSSFVMSVGATSLQNRLEIFSSRGPTPDGRIKPDISAPDGVLVSRQTFGRFFGTSASSPHVAGAAALVKFAFPQFSPVEIQSYLESHAEDLGPVGKDPLFGAGLLTLGSIPFTLNLPSAPTDLSAEVISATQIDLRWRDNSDNEEGFIIERRLESEIDPEVLLVDPETEAFSDEELVPETLYCYRIRSFTADAASEPSNEACAKTLAPGPTALLGSLLIVKFLELQFLQPRQWAVTFQWGCVIYENNSGSEATLHIKLVDLSKMDVIVPPGNDVITCGQIAHIDTRVKLANPSAAGAMKGSPAGVSKTDASK